MRARCAFALSIIHLSVPPLLCFDTLADLDAQKPAANHHTHVVHLGGVSCVVCLCAFQEAEEERNRNRVASNYRESACVCVCVVCMADCVAPFTLAVYWTSKGSLQAKWWWALPHTSQIR